MASAAPVCTTEGGISRQVLTVLGMMNIVEGFTMNVIWPFLPFMVEAFGVATEDTVGLYVGILGWSHEIKRKAAHQPTSPLLHIKALKLPRLQVRAIIWPPLAVLLCGVCLLIGWVGGRRCWLARSEPVWPILCLVLRQTTRLLCLAGDASFCYTTATTMSE